MSNEIKLSKNFIDFLAVSVLIILVLSLITFGDLINKYNNAMIDKATLESKVHNYETKIKELSRPIVYKTITKKYTGIYPRHLRNIINKTLEYLQVKDKDIKDWNRLLYLTVIAESDSGALTRQIGGPAKSIFQVEPKTERETLDWLKAKKPDLYERIRSLRVPAKLEIHEGEYNLAYSTALAYGVYLWKGAKPQGKTDFELAGIHKKLYNTYLGKGSVKRTMKLLSKRDMKL